MTTVSQYNPEHSHVSETAMTEFLHRKDLTDLCVIPGLGPVSKEHILTTTRNCPQPIETGYALIGKYLTFKKENMTVVEHANVFFRWLEECGLHQHVNIHKIVHVVAEKANLMMDGLYTTAAWPEFHAKMIGKVGSQHSQRSQDARKA
jgi:hypothetical protein